MNQHTPGRRPGYEPRHGYQAAPGYQQASQQQQYQQPGYPPTSQYEAPATGVQQPYGMVACRLCGHGPAARATFRGITGMVILHTVYTSHGPFCRDCGLAMFRQQTTRSLTGGWFSFTAIFATPIFVIVNLAARGKVAALPAPQPYTTGRIPAPLNPGKPVTRRPGAYLYPTLVGIFLILVIIGALSG